jgi:tripartite-type tricarboxylate transporter receptor subunit TctC
MFATLPNVMQNGGALKVLAIATPERSGAVPQVPTTAESGFAAFAVSSIYSVLAPAGTPAEVVGRLNRDLQAAVADPPIRDRLLAQGVVPLPGPPADTAAQLGAEVTRWAAVIREARLQLQ